MAVVGGGPSFSFTHNSIVDSDEFRLKIGNMIESLGVIGLFYSITIWLIPFSIKFWDIQGA